MHEAQVLMYELQAYPTAEVLIRRGDHIQSFKTASDLMQHVDYIRSYFGKLEMALKMQAEFTGVPDNPYSVYNSFKATEDMKFLMHNIVPEIIKKEFNYFDIFVTVYPQVVKSKEGYDVAGFVVNRPFTVEQARQYREKVSGLNQRMRIHNDGTVSFNFVCSLCGVDTSPVDMEYLIGTDHLECRLKEENKTTNFNTI